MRFEILIGPDDGEIIECSKVEVRIGRKREENDFVLPYDIEASRKHAKVIKKGESFTVVDRDSTRGTIIRGKCHLHPKEGKEGEAELTPGDVLIMGKTLVRFLG